MASFFYHSSLVDLLTGVIDLDSDTIKIMLVSGYTPNSDDDFASTPASSEISVTNYASGFAGSGRKTVSVAVGDNSTDDRCDVELNGGSALTWSSLGSGATIDGAVLYHHQTSDAASRLIAYFDLTDTATNGGDVSLTFNSLASGGNLRISV